MNAAPITPQPAASPHPATSNQMSTEPTSGPTADPAPSFEQNGSKSEEKEQPAPSNGPVNPPRGSSSASLASVGAPSSALPSIKEYLANDWAAMVKTFNAPDSVLDPMTLVHVKKMAQREREAATQREKEAPTVTNVSSAASSTLALPTNVSSVTANTTVTNTTASNIDHLGHKYAVESTGGTASSCSSGAREEAGVQTPECDSGPAMTAEEKEQLNSAKRLLCENAKGYMHMAQWLAKVFSPSDSAGWFRNRLKKRMIETFDEERADQVRTFVGGLPIDEALEGVSTPKGYQTRSHGAYPQWLDKFVHIKEWREVVYSLQKTKSTRLLTQVVEMISDRGFDREVQTAEGAASTTYIVFCRSVKAFFYDHFPQLVEGQYEGDLIKAQLAKFRKEWTLPYTLALIKSLARSDMARANSTEDNDKNTGGIGLSWISDMENALVRDVHRGSVLTLWFSCLGCYPDVFTLVSNWIKDDGSMAISNPNDLTKLLDAVNIAGSGQNARGSEPSCIEARRSAHGSSLPHPGGSASQETDMLSKVDSFHMPAVSATGDEYVHGLDSKRQMEGLGDALATPMILRAIATAYVHLELTLDQRRAGTCLYDRLGYSADMETIYHIVNNSRLSFTQKCRKLRKQHGHGAAVASILWLKHNVEKSPFATWCVDSGKPLTKFLHCIIKNFPRKDIVEECLAFLRTLFAALFELDEEKHMPGQCVYSNAQVLCSLYPQLGNLLAYTLLETQQISIIHFVIDILPQVDYMLIKKFVAVVFERICPPYSQSFSSLWARFLHSPRVADALSGDPKLRKMAKEYGSDQSDSDSSSLTKSQRESDDDDDDDMQDKEGSQSPPPKRSRRLDFRS